MTKSDKTAEHAKYSAFISEILSEKLFESGSELRKRLVDKFGVKDFNARKIIERVAKSKEIKSSKPYTFGKGQFIYLLPDQDITVGKIKAICVESRPPLYRLLQYMENHGGISSYYEAMKITASPDENSSTKVTTLPDMIKVLVKLNLVYEKQDKNGVNYIIFQDQVLIDRELIGEDMMASHYSRMLIDSSLMPDIIRWLAKANLIDNVGARYRNKKTPSFGAKLNGLLWDAYSFTKATGINPTVAKKASGRESQTVVVLEVVLSEPFSQLDLDGFLARVQININSVQNQSRKVMPIIIYKSCSDEVMNKIRSLGFLAFDIASIFGTRIYAVLNKLKELNNLVLTDENIEGSVKKVLKLIRSAGQEDALKDLKGVLFEVLMFPFLKSLFPNSSVDRGRTLTTENPDGKKEGFEYDYIFNSSQPQEIVVVELKGYNSHVSVSLGNNEKKASLKWFFEHTLPFAKKQYHKEIKEGKNFKGIYITTGTFWEDGHQYVKTLSAGKLKSVNAEVAYDRDALLVELRKKNFDTEVKIIETYYVKQDEESEADS